MGSKAVATATDRSQHWLQLWWTLNWSTLGIFISVVGGFLTMQTARLRFRFTSSAIDVLRVRGLSDTGSESEKAGKLATDAGDADVTTKETAPLNPDQPG